MTATKKALALTIPTKEALFTAMEKGATLITPNNRLSNQLLNEFFNHKPSRVKDKPRCFPYQTFLRERYKKARHLYAHMAHPVILTPQQQRYLWQQILHQEQEQCNEGLIAEVQEAWRRCQHWQIDYNHPDFAQTPQTRQFQRWQQRFQEHLTERGALTEEQLSTQLLTYPELLDLRIVIWACFDDYTPQQIAVQQAIENTGCEQYDYDLAERAIRIQQYPAKDLQDENLQLIQWLNHKLAAGEQRIAVVVPELQSHSQPLQRLLQRHIPPHLFNISLGLPLLDYPLVAHALQWLTLKQPTLSNYQARLLLHSPYLTGSKTELNARTNHLEECTLLQEPFIAVSSFARTVAQTAPQIAALLDNLPALPEVASPLEWVGYFKNRLAYLGFPGEYPLISSAYQCFQRLMTLFDDFLPLSVISPAMNKLQALNALRDLAKSTIFQPQTPTTPIQILGLLEASGCTFESIWVSGLTDQCLPQKTRLSAFIPINLQRNYGMPHACPLRELQFAQQTLHRLKNGGNDVVFSYPQLTGDSPNLPSPLITHLPELNVQTTLENFSSSSLVRHNEVYVLPLPIHQHTSGGTALLANQAKCPFRAFATHRLHAKPALPMIDGLDLSERGQIMHKIMQLLWIELENQDHLFRLTNEALQEKIKQAIEQAMRPMIKENRASFPTLVQEIEASRLQDIVNNSLLWEKKRPPFKVEALEKDFTVELASMTFRVRIDRLDSINDDKKWVIDYKSSLPANKPWNEERPEAPQLLIYALLDPNINTLLFLQLKAGQIACSGLSEDSLPLQGVSTLKKDEHWSDRQDQWHQQLTLLANEFREGHCSPKPNRASTCQQCDFPNLCRIGGRIK